VGEVALATCTVEAARPPTLTVVCPAMKSMPVIVTAVPPATEPHPGTTPAAATAGGPSLSRGLVFGYFLVPARSTHM
jgi:hypothetical protein